jgi:DNA polymerase-1
MSEEKKLFLIDGFAMIYRAYFAFIKNPRINSRGLNTSAMFGFTNLLNDVLKKHKPTHLAVVFDPMEDDEEVEDRTTLYEDYKAHREPMPEDLQKSLPYIEKLVAAYNVPLLVMNGYEADDLVGTLVKKAEQKGFKCYMMTHDKDYGQLVSDNIFWYRPGSYGNPDEVLGVAEVCKKFDVKTPEQVIDLLGLMGDSADNIPGIKGVGEKTAQKFIKEYGSVEGLLANTDKLTGKMKEKVEEGAEMARLSRILATIITDVPIEFDEEQLRVKEWNKPALKEIFAELEFRTLSERLLGESLSQVQVVTRSVGGQGDLFATDEENAAPVVTKTSTQPKETVVREEKGESQFVDLKKLIDVPHQYFTVTETVWRKELLAELLQQTEVSVDTETTGLDPLVAEIVGLSFCFKKNQAFYIPMPVEFEKCVEILAEFKPVFESETITKIGQNIKYDMQILKNYGCEIKGPIYDTMLAHYVFQPEQRHGMDYLSQTFLHYTPISTEEIIGPKGKKQKSMRDIEVEKVSEYCNEDTDVTYQLKQVFVPQVKNVQTDQVLEKIELPLVPVLCNMERAGIRINEEFLANYSAQLKIEADKHEQAVYDQAGEQFNLASPKQLGDVLFEKLKLTIPGKKKIKTTKTGQYATGEEVLVLLAEEHQIVRDILEFRELTKLRSTYVDALPELVNKKTGRVHTTFQQAIAVTGRLSSQYPNLQNIPVRTERGKEIRKAFIARDSDHVLLSADYSQIELRVIAALSGDVNMCDAFVRGIDIHTATAAKVFGVSETEVTKEMRYKAKSVNFGIIYGQGQRGLADNLKISSEEAGIILNSYKEQYKSIDEFKESQIEFARENGYVQTLLGRKRWLADINEQNGAVRSFAERNAVNMPIQGSAADMIKLAMIKIDAAMKKAGLKSKMVLQVHDELVFDALRSEVELLKPIILENMQNAMPLPNDVPVIAEVGMGDNWLEAH